MKFDGTDYPLLMEGNPDAKILVVCDPPLHQEVKARKPLYGNKRDTFLQITRDNGFKYSDFFFITPSNKVIPIEAQDSEARKKEFLKEYKYAFDMFVNSFKPKIILALGKQSMFQITGKSHKINSIRGLAGDFNQDYPILPTLAMGQIARSPEKLPTFNVDISTLKSIVDNDFNINYSKDRFEGTDYKYVDNIQFLIDKKPKMIAVDTETTGLEWHQSKVRVLTIQASWEEGKAVASIVSPAYDKELSFRKSRALIAQWKVLLEDPSIKKVAHNFKYDHHMLKKIGINTQGWYADTAQLAFALDENMENKSQSECIKRWVPSMSGYSDEFDKKHDKSKMILVPKEEMLMYACGDADTCLRLAKVQIKALQKDPKQAKVFTTVQMPALRAFADMEEYGIKLDTQKVRDLKVELEARERQLYDDILAEIKPAVKRKHLHDLSLTRKDFIRDALFTKEGANLKPVVFTKTTKNLAPHLRVASTSIREHLPYFEHIPLIKNIIEYSQIQKGITTYVGDEEDNTGFWKHIDKVTGKIHPNFLLWGTVTGRTSCVHEDTIINTNNGKKKIIDIRPGDKVLTHKNNWKDVKHLIIKPDQDMYNIFLGNGEVLTCTEEHKLLTNKGEWVTLRDVYFKEALKRSERKAESKKSLREIIINNRAGSEKRKYRSSHCISYPERGIRSRSFQKIKSIKIFGVKKRRKESYEREKTSELQRRMLRSKRLSNSDSRWETVFRSQSNNGKAFKNTCEGFAEEFSSPSYRRKPLKQSYRQSSFSNKSGSRRDTRKVQKNESEVRIERIEFSGVYPVYDLTVADDHSYECAGIFNHNSKEPNAQNFPKRGPIAKAYRKIFIPRPGYTLVEVDLSQAELRIAAWMANETNMINIYKSGGDIHVSTAAAVMGITIEDFYKLDEETQKQKRYEAKAVNFGFLYGMGVDKFIEYAKTQYKVNYTRSEAKKARDRFFKAYPKLLIWHKTMINVVNKLGYVRGLHGAKRNLPSVRSRDNGAKSQAERQAINSPVQRLGSDIGLMALTRLSRDIPDNFIKPIAFIHDALVCEVKTDRLFEGCAAIKWYMESVPFKKYFGIEPPLPIVADVSVGDNLSEMVELGGMKEVKYNETVIKYGSSNHSKYFDNSGSKYNMKSVKPTWFNSKSKK
jgi:DNA polymerase I-like protein with 3'-5' exonuclease and polymerase domains/uracil-DNA glycosylase